MAGKNDIQQQSRFAECGELVLQKLFLDFVRVADKRIVNSSISSQDAESLHRQFLRGRDTEFDRLLTALGQMAEYCLSSVIRHAFDWRLTKLESDDRRMRQGVEFIFCHLLIETLKQLNVHPIPERDINTILNLAFEQFESADTSADPTQAKICELYAEALGVVSEHRHPQVRQRFLAELRNLRHKAVNLSKSESILNGMKYFKVKMYPIEDFTESINFLKELGDYFHDAIDNKDQALQKCLAKMTSEILEPLAENINNEVNVPVLRHFVDSLYPSVLELSKQRGFKNFPWVARLVQLLLAVSQKQFFLNHWSIFLQCCLGIIQKKKFESVSLECVSRLVWVYCIRHGHADANATTTSRLTLITKTLFPAGARHTIPKNQQSIHFVRILSYIADIKLELAMATIEDLLGVAANKTTNPERVQICVERQRIGLRAFVAIANSFQQREKPKLPPITYRPSGNTIRGKNKFLHTPLFDEQARLAGLDKYLPTVQRALWQLMLTLHNQVGYDYLITKSLKFEDISQEKIDLLTLCVSAIPRILPEGFRSYKNRSQILRIISQLTIHQSSMVVEQALRSLDGIITELPEYREDVIAIYCTFILTEIHDSHEMSIDTAVAHLTGLVERWAEVHSAGNNTDCPSILDRLDGFCLFLLANNAESVRVSSVSLIKSVVVLADTLGLQNSRLLHILNECSIRQMNIESLRAMIGKYATCRAEEWRDKLDEIIQFIWANSTQVVPHKRSQSKNFSLILYFTFLDTFERIRCGPWETLAAGNMNVPFIGSGSRSRAQPSASGYMQQWGNYLLASLASTPVFGSREATSHPTGTSDWMTCTALINASKTPDALFKWILDSLQNTSENAKKELITTCLARTSIEAIDLLLQELKLSEAAPSSRRKNKRDRQRFQTAKVMAELAELGKLATEVKSDKETDVPIREGVVDYAINCYEYFQGVNLEQDYSEDRDQRKFNFIRLLIGLIRNCPESHRKHLFSTEIRSKMASLFGTWCPSLASDLNQLSCMALIGRCSILLAGTVELDPRFSAWLSRLLLLEENEQIKSAISQISAVKCFSSIDALIIEFVSALLRANNDQLFEFSSELMRRCYQADAELVNRRALLALASVVGSEGWDRMEAPQREQMTRMKVPLLVLAMANMSNENSQVAQASQLFVQVLAKHCSKEGKVIESTSPEKYPEVLAAELIDLTFPILTEIFLRLQNRGAENFREDLVDPKIGQIDNSLNFFYEARLLSLLLHWLRKLQLDSCSSKESLFIINNLLFCTYTFSRRHPVVTREVWFALGQNEQNAMIVIYSICAMARLDNLDQTVVDLFQDVMSEITYASPNAFEYLITSLNNHGPVPYNVQRLVEKPSWIVKKVKSDSPNGSVNSAKIEGSLSASRNRRTLTASSVEFGSKKQSSMRDRAPSHKELFYSQEDDSTRLDNSHVNFEKSYLPFAKLLPDHFYSTKASLGSICLLFVPRLLDDRRRCQNSLSSTIPSILVASILYLDSNVSDIREAARLSLLAIAHRQLVSSELSEGARVLLQQLEQRGQLLLDAYDSGYHSSSTSSITADLPSPMSIQSLLTNASCSSSQSSLTMMHFLCTTRKFWIKELASPSFLPSSLRSSAQLKHLTESLINVFGNDLKSKLGDLAIVSAISSPSHPITCRAVQLYRSLQIKITERTLNKMISRAEQSKLESKSTSTGAITSTGKSSYVVLADERNERLDDDDARILSIFLQVGIALLHSDFEHEFRMALKLISQINHIVPIRLLVHWCKRRNIHPAKDLQKMLWKGLVKEKDVSYDAVDLDIEVYQVLTELLPSSSSFGDYGFSLQLSSLLPRLYENFVKLNPQDINAARRTGLVIKLILSQTTSESTSLKTPAQIEAGQNLEKIMRMYAKTEYKNGNTTWLSAACKYLHEFEPDAINDQLDFYLTLIDSRDCASWLCAASAAIIRYLLEHCLNSHYPPASLNNVICSLTKIVQQSHKAKNSPTLIDNALSALQSIVARAATLFSPGDSRSSSPVYSNLMPGRVLDFEVDYNEVDEVRRPLVPWKRNPTGREVKKKLRYIAHNSIMSNNTVTSRPPSVHNISGKGDYVDSDPGVIKGNNLASSISESNAAMSTEEGHEDDTKTNGEHFESQIMKDFDFLYDDSTAGNTVDYLYEYDDFTSDPKPFSPRHDSAHDTERENELKDVEDKEENDDEIDLRYPSESDNKIDMIDLRPGNSNSQEDSDPVIMKPVKQKKKKEERRRRERVLEMMEFDGNSSDTSTQSKSRTFVSPLKNKTLSVHRTKKVSTSSHATTRPLSSMSESNFSELELPWCSTLPLSPSLKHRWQKLIEKGDNLAALPLFPNIWNALRASTNWILSSTKDQMKSPSTSSVIVEIDQRFREICQVMNELCPSIVFATKSAINEEMTTTLALGISKLSHGLENFAIHDTNTRNCMDYMNSKDLAKQLEYCKLLYLLFFQLNQILMEYDEITRQVYNGRNLSHTDLSRKMNTLMSFFENCFNSHPDMKHFELLSPDPQEVFGCAEMGDVGGVLEIVQKYGKTTAAASPESGAFFALAASCFLGMSKEGVPEVARTARWQQLDAGKKFQTISNRLLEVDRFIKAQIRNAEAESRSGSRRGRRQSSTNSFVQTRMSVEDLETDNSTSLYSRSLNNDQKY
ncbi:Oidioi.mRNA.OKI2018_I69.XSR.g14850.t1.cds [Oikopleura dioica]|uniref:Oidioi.mRNA.OKI2018_I69.XSR.g14850.t1.cds n=1 Tax=Oikopleura dioica TaxID=34765 RepID=A0ABN7SAZ1_OIKDI|nr:Oidioi.mRNA.OKI2018_I69.XSR.g14850.t1.cds [Oikopleura dioica]